jgi:26S proteasome regulatory subunit N9
MELVFNKSAEERTLPFKSIADATKLPVEEVELLVMKALSLKLVKGVIDEVNQTVAINWVQPRVLDLEQVNKMKSRVSTWMDTTNQVLAYLETTTAPELFT